MRVMVERREPVKAIGFMREWNCKRCAERPTRGFANLRSLH